MVPLSFVDVVKHAQRQHAHAEDVRHSQVEHVDVERRALSVRAGENEQSETVPNQTEHRDEGVDRGVDLVPEVIDRGAVSGVWERQGAEVFHLSLLIHGGSDLSQILV